MKFVKKVAAKIFWIFSMMIPQKKQFIIYYINDFLNCRYFKNLKLREKIRCYSKGYLPYEFFAYDIKNNGYKNYLPAYYNYKKTNLNGDFNYLLCNKILCEEYVKAIINGIDHLHVIESIGYIEDGYLQSLHINILSGEYYSLNHFLGKSDLILKPIFGSKGKGVLVLQKVDDGHYLLDNKSLNWNELILILKSLDDYIIQERFRQYGFSNNIYPGSLNTMRIATMIDPVTKETFIAYAVHRIGSRYSGYKDNFNQGGLSALIDINTGKLSKALSVSVDGKIELNEFHPLSNKPIYNEQIPNWRNLSKSIIEMARRMPFFKYVGWDIILSDNELYILEGNNCPGLDVVQIHKPIKEFTAAWNFFQYYKFTE